MARKAKRPEWQICPECSGDGKSSAYLGAFTREAMDEQGPEFLDEYMRGGYDKPCARCSSSGKIDVNGEREAARADLESDPAWQSERWLREIGA